MRIEQVVEEINGLAARVGQRYGHDSFDRRRDETEVNTYRMAVRSILDHTVDMPGLWRLLGEFIDSWDQVNDKNNSDLAAQLGQQAAYKHVVELLEEYLVTEAIREARRGN